MKRPESLLKEYATRLSDDNLKFLNARLSQRLSGDIPEVLDFYSRATNLDNWLASAKSCNDLYDMVDATQTYIDKEYSKRFESTSVR